MYNTLPFKFLQIVKIEVGYTLVEDTALRMRAVISGTDALGKDRCVVEHCLKSLIMMKDLK